MQLVERAKASLQKVSAADIDLKKYMHAEERNRVVPMAALAERSKALMLLGADHEPGLLMPWDKAKDKIKIIPGKLVIWCGWSRHGKSQMLKQLMLQAISVSEKVCIASMEEETHEVWSEMCRMGVGKREPAPHEIDEFVKFGTGWLWLYDQQGDVSPERIKAVIRYCAQELGVTQFVVDSLMMISLGRDDYEGQARFVGELKTIAKDTGCTVHLVAHMRKREGKSGDEVPGSLHDIAGGHEIGSKADYVFNVWRDIERRNPSNPDCVLSVDKQRGNVNWLGKLGLNFHHQSRQFVEDIYAMKFWRDS